ncbi:Esterase lipase thioesterase active site [Coemansia sp. Benny D115]|nr:Esterase lipase thioesterase active site [Coemansia sp. Benny D115]
MAPTIAPYGSWKSPLSAESVASASSSVSFAMVDRANPSRVFWLESRPSEGGRYTLLSKLVDDYADETLVEHLRDKQWNVRTAVHEYGGGAYTVLDSLVVFANWKDQGVYVFDVSDASNVPRRIGSRNDKLRYANFAVHRSKKFVVCVREDHREAGVEAKNTLVAVALPDSANEGDTGECTEDVVLFSGTDFVSSPVFSPVNDEVAFFTWNHPDMNWDATTLWRARIQVDAQSGLPTGLDQVVVVAGGPEGPRESIYQPRFDDSGVLHFISDRIGGFWNPHHVDETGKVVLSLGRPMQAEFATPEWTFGCSTFQPVPGQAGKMAVTYTMDGRACLGILDTQSGKIDDLPVPDWSAIGSLQLATASRSGSRVLVLIAGGPTESVSLFTYYIDGIGAQRLIGQEAGAGIQPKQQVLSKDSISVAREVVFPTVLPADESGKRKEAEAYAYFYEPANSDYIAPEGELPPLLVIIHGGPTAATSAVYQSKVQYWTSRGFAVADVNYGGSTGYGRAYRERLYPQFGVVDVQDCCAAALHLADIGLVDRRRLSIMGGSAGGFTTLACLAFRPEVFAVGASLYGISDLEVLAQETHKFEARYPDHLVGEYPAKKHVYHVRSPLYAVDRLSCPVIFLQGLEDRVVPPNQATLMADALRKKGVAVALVEFAGEQHGFRQAANIKRALEAQLYFFGKVLGFEPADAIEPVPIDNA